MLIENADIWPSNGNHNANLLVGISEMIWKKTPPYLRVWGNQCLINCAYACAVIITEF